MRLDVVDLKIFRPPLRLAGCRAGCRLVYVMPSKAKGEKELKWKLARRAAWDFLPASLLREVPAVWVPGIDLVPSGEDVPWVSSIWGKTVWGAGQETWTPVGATGVSGRRFGPVHVFRYRPNRVGVATRA